MSCLCLNGPFGLSFSSNFSSPHDYPSFRRLDRRFMTNSRGLIVLLNNRYVRRLWYFFPCSSWALGLKKITGEQCFRMNLRNDILFRNLHFVATLCFLCLFSRCLFEWACFLKIHRPGNIFLGFWCFRDTHNGEEGMSSDFLNALRSLRFILIVAASA